MKEELIFLRVLESNVDRLSEELSDLHFAARRQRRDPAFWRWRYFHNPLKKGILIVALKGGRVVGMNGLLYLSLIRQGRIAIGGYMGDHSIHPSLKSWRCYSGLTHMSWTEERRDKASFRFGVAPSNLTELFQRSGVINLGSLPIYLGFLSLEKILKQHFLPFPLSLVGRFFQPFFIGLKHEKEEVNFDFRPVQDFDSTFDELWSNISGMRTVSIVKDSAYLNWRYAGFQGADFIRLAVYLNERLDGLGVFRYSGLRDNSLILELLARDDNPQILKALIRRILSELKAKGISQVTASFPATSPAAAAFRDFGFKPWGAKFWLTPQLIVASPKEEDRAELLLKNWDLSLGDWMVI